MLILGIAPGLRLTGYALISLTTWGGCRPHLPNPPTSPTPSPSPGHSPPASPTTPPKNKFANSLTRSRADSLSFPPHCPIMPIQLPERRKCPNPPPPAPPNNTPPFAAAPH